MNSEKELHEMPTVAETCDCFCGVIAIFEDTNLMTDKRYWVEHQRKDIYTDYMTLDEAKAQMQAFVDDTMF